MIPLLLAGLRLLASEATSADTASSVHLRFGTGFSVTRAPSSALWFDLTAQATFDGLFARYEPGFVLSRPDDPEISMAAGRSEPDTDRLRQALVVGWERRYSHGWLAVGLGWSWTRFDTLGAHVESRQVFVDSPTGIRPRECPDLYGGCNHVGWVWKETYRRSSPLLSLEAGLGLRRSIGFGWRFFAEITSESRLGLEALYELP